MHAISASYDDESCLDLRVLRNLYTNLSGALQSPAFKPMPLNAESNIDSESALILKWILRNSNLHIGF